MDVNIVQKFYIWGRHCIKTYIRERRLGEVCIKTWDTAWMHAWYGA
jgi:hypothetical protein